MRFVWLFFCVRTMKDIEKNFLSNIRNTLDEYNKSSNTNFHNYKDAFRHVLMESGATMIDTLYEADEYDIVNINHFENRQIPFSYIYINPKKNTISFTLQNGIDKNGCTISAMIDVAKSLLECINSTNRCRDISSAITKLDESIMWLNKKRRSIDIDMKEEIRNIL